MSNEIYTELSIHTSTEPSYDPNWDTDALWLKTHVSAYYNRYNQDTTLRNCVKVGTFVMQKSAFDRRYLSDENQLFWAMDRLDGDLTWLFDFNGDGWSDEVCKTIDRDSRYCNIWVVDYSLTEMKFFMSNKMLQALSIFITDFVDSDDFIIISAHDNFKEKERHFKQLNFIGIENKALILDCHLMHHFFDVDDEELNKASDEAHELGELHRCFPYYRYNRIYAVEEELLRPEHKNIMRRW